MGRGKRKRKTRDRHAGRRSKVSSGMSDLGAEQVGDIDHIQFSDLEGADHKAEAAGDINQEGSATQKQVAGAGNKSQEGSFTKEEAAAENINQEGSLTEKRIVCGVSRDGGDWRPSEAPRGILADDSDGGRGPSVYLIACHWDWSRSTKPYTVYKMVDVAASVEMVDVAPSADSTCSLANRKRLRRLNSLETDAGGKIFTSVQSRHGPWIVGVGGDHGSTVIFDTRTRDVIHGPSLKSAKWCPVLMAVGDRVYAMSKIPSWNFDPDFPPWFEVLDLSKSRVITDAGCSYLEGCSWSELPIPPCFPWKLSPTEYTMLPIVILMSYVVVGHYIIVSFNQPWGTLAFDTGSHEWHKVNDERLPFTGCAVRHGSIFLALSKKDGPINAYCISVAPSGKDNALKFSVKVLPVKHEDHEVDAGSCFSSMDNEHFCSTSISLDSDSLTLNRQYNEWFPKKALVNLMTYHIENSIHKTTKGALLDVKPTIEVSRQREQNLKISSSHGFSPFAYTLLSI